MVGSKVYSTIRNNIGTKLNTSKQDKLTSEKYISIYWIKLGHPNNQMLNTKHIFKTVVPYGLKFHQSPLYISRYTYVICMYTLCRYDDIYDMW